MVTDKEIDEVFKSMPSGPTGFCKEWGYRQFAREILNKQTERAQPENDPALLWAEIYRLRAALKGPGEHDTWQHAALEERHPRGLAVKQAKQAEEHAAFYRWLRDEASNHHPCWEKIIGRGANGEAMDAIMREVIKQGPLDKGLPYQQRVVCAANRDENKNLLLGTRHFDLLMRKQTSALGSKGNKTDLENMHAQEEGFIDQQGVFLTRTEAWKVAVAAGQVLKRVGGDTTDGGTLYSENLY